MCTCTHTHTHTCMHTHTHTHTHTHMHAHTHTCMNTHTHTYTCTHTHTQKHTHMHVRTHTHTQAHIHTHTHKTRMCTHTHTQSLTLISHHFPVQMPHMQGLCWMLSQCSLGQSATEEHTTLFNTGTAPADPGNWQTQHCWLHAQNLKQNKSNNMHGHTQQLVKDDKQQAQYCFFFFFLWSDCNHHVDYFVTLWRVNTKTNKNIFWITPVWWPLTQMRQWSWPQWLPGAVTHTAGYTYNAKWKTKQIRSLGFTQADNTRHTQQDSPLRRHGGRRV